MIDDFRFLFICWGTVKSVERGLKSKIFNLKS